MHSNKSIKYTLLVTLAIGIFTSVSAKQGYPDENIKEYTESTSAKESQKRAIDLLKKNSSITIRVTGEGVAPSFAISPAQAYILAKRAATADAYRLIAERVKGVVIEGKDSVKNMVIEKSTIAAHVQAMIRNASVTDITFKDGLCEVEMEIRIYYNQFNN